MAERKYRQIDSPWIDMSHLDWGPLTDERYARHFFRGHIFYGQQEYSENVFIIKRGRVAMCLCTPEGDMRNTMVLDAGCMFGNQTRFDGSPNSCQAEVVSDEADVYVIPKEEASSRIRDNFQMTHNILMQSNRINRMLLTQIELMSFHHSEGRVCFYLLHLAEQERPEPAVYPLHPPGHRRDHRPEPGVRVQHHLRPGKGQDPDEEIGALLCGPDGRPAPADQRLRRELFGLNSPVCNGVYRPAGPFLLDYG